MTARPSDHDLTALVESAASGAVDSAFSVGKSRLEWSGMGPEQKNAVRESALPFIFHGMKALADLGYSKPRTITTAEELDALPSEVVILDANQVPREGLRGIDGARNYWRSMGPARMLRSYEIPLPATVLYEPQP